MSKKHPLNKKLGKTIILSGDEELVVPRIKTGLPALDVIIGGGLPKGKIAEVYGLQQTGKSTLCLQIAKSFQEQNLKVVWADLENAWDREYAENLGINLKELTMIKADYGEEAFEAMEFLINEKQADLIIVDSVSAIAPRAELEAEVGKSQMGSQARLIAQAFRRLIPAMAKTGAIIIFINQLRVNIMGGQYDPYTRPGGFALKFYERTAIQLQKKGALKQGETIIGSTIRARAVKSYSTKPFASCEMRLMFGEGFSAEADIIGTGVELGIIDKKGNTYSFHGAKLGVGAEKARIFLKENPEIMKEIQAEL